MYLSAASNSSQNNKLSTTTMTPLLYGNIVMTILQEFLQHLNRLHNRIFFTMEKEDDHKLHFLDERTNNRLKTDVYRKPTYTWSNHYLHYRSNHHPRVKSEDQG